MCDDDGRLTANRRDSMNKRFILWDNDGVLVDTERWYYEATRRLISGLGIELSREQYIEFSSRAQSCWDLARKAGFAEEVIREKRAERDLLYREFLRTERIAVEAATEVVRELAGRFRMAIVTSAAPEDIALQHSASGILQLMEFAITGEEASHYKPHPAPYLAALARFGAVPAEAVAVEDSTQGLHAACGAGIDCVIVRNAFTLPKDLSAAWRTIDSVRDLPNVLAEA
jgi:HAD superfamily hydrolase (TIGR01509 family)